MSGRTAHERRRALPEADFPNVRFGSMTAIQATPGSGRSVEHPRTVSQAQTSDFIHRDAKLGPAFPCGLSAPSHRGRHWRQIDENDSDCDGHHPAGAAGSAEARGCVKGAWSVAWRASRGHHALLARRRVRDRHH